MVHNKLNSRVHRLVLLMVALVAISYIRVQHYAVNSHHSDERAPTSTRRLAQRSGVESVEELVAAESPVHGFVRKGGITALANWHPAYATLRKEQFKAWLAQKGSLLSDGGTAGFNLLGVKPPYILPFHNARGCNIYYNERYKIVFVRTQKVASTTTMTFFGECANEPDRPSCLRPLDLEDALQLQLMWRNYFVFGWTRNPWSRAVSSYQYLLHAVVDKPHCDRITWDTFCQDPLVFGDLCAAHPGCCPHFNKNFMNFHVNDQTTCLTTDSGEWSADFIGRAEHFDEDFALVVAEINRRLPPGVEPLSVAARPESQNTNEVGCSDELQPRPKRSEQPQQGEGGGSGAGGGGEAKPEEAAASAAAAAAAAGGAGAATAADPAAAAAAEQGEAAQAASQPAGAAAAAAAAADPAAAAAQEQQQPATQPQQGEGGRRRLLYGKLPGFLFAPENYCVKSKFYTGRHAACFQQISRFYGSDLRRLGFSQLMGEEPEPAGELPTGVQ